MADVRFVQIHSLHGYSAALLNRDDSGLAKRLTYGGSVRTRVSSQCLKRHWRVADGTHALDRIDGARAAIRSRETVTRRVISPLEADGSLDPTVVKHIAEAFQKAVYGEKGADLKNRQPLLLGEPEIAYLASEARKLANACGKSPEEALKAAKKWGQESKANMKALRESCALPGGLAAALFGRMVTSDVEANIDAAVHVAHSFTVHAEESESDYFTVVDDLKASDEDAGAAHINETELTSGLFYGYVVLDRRILVENLGGDTTMAGTVSERLVNLIATVSPGAKLGSTAPYSYACWMLVEAGDRQPRSLAEAFRNPCKASAEAAQRAAHEHLAKLDDTYGGGESRRMMCLSEPSANGVQRVKLPELATWAGDAIKAGKI